MPAVNDCVAVHRINIAADVLRGGADRRADGHLREAAHFLGQGQRIQHVA